MKERVALVTGGNRGIGLEVCKQLCKKGFKVILGTRNVTKGDQAVYKIGNTENPPDICKLDVTKDEEIDKALLYILEKYGKLDVLINNAAIFIDKDQMAANVDVATIKRTLEANFYGPLKLTQRIIPHMKRNGFGHIINVSSRLGAIHQMGGNHPGYRLSKAMLNALTLMLDSELKETGVIVNTMSPGWVRTEMGGYNASRSISKGAETIVWLALQEQGFPSGKFYMDMEEIEW